MELALLSRGRACITKTLTFRSQTGYQSRDFVENPIFLSSDSLQSIDLEHCDHSSIPCFSYGHLRECNKWKTLDQVTSLRLVNAGHAQVNVLLMDLIKLAPNTTHLLLRLPHAPADTSVSPSDISPLRHLTGVDIEITKDNMPTIVKLLHDSNHLKSLKVKFVHVAPPKSPEESFAKQAGLHNLKILKVKLSPEDGTFLNNQGFPHLESVLCHIEHLILANVPAVSQRHYQSALASLQAYFFLPGRLAKLDLPSMPTLQSLTLDFQVHQPAHWCPDLGLHEIFVVNHHEQFQTLPNVKEIRFLLRSSACREGPQGHHLHIQVRHYRHPLSYRNLFQYRYTAAIVAVRPPRSSSSKSGSVEVNEERMI